MQTSKRSLAVDAELLDDNLYRRVKKLRTANQRVRYLANAEEEALFKTLKGQDWVKDIIVMAINTGMRRGELFDLKWLDVDFNRRIVHVRQSKSGRPRVIPLNSTTQTLLKGLQKTCEYVFPSPKKSERRVNDVGRQFERAVKNAKIADFHFHDLRHTAATRMADAGADPFTLAAILGHSDIRMTARYTHAADQAKRRAVDNLVKLESNSDASEPEDHKLRAVENPAVASNLEIFGNGLAPEMKTARSASP